jgi:tripartite ATP-independent transporter DctP family solute receptor
MKLKILAFLIAIALIPAAVFAGGETETTGDATAPRVLTWSSVSVPADAHTKAMHTFKFWVEKLSNGRITCEVYDSGQLFTQEAELDAVIKGDLDIAYFGANWVAEYVPYVSMFGSAFIFSGYEHMRRVLGGDIGEQVFEDVVDAVGVRPLEVFYLGTRELNLRDIGREVRTPEDMAGIKLRTPGSASWLAMGRALGADPTPMSFSEVYLGLKTGAIDGQDNPLPTDKNANFYEVTEYIILTHHVVGTVWPCMNEQTWQSFSPEDQEIIRQAMEEARKVCDETNLAAEAELVQFFIDQGMTIIDDPDLDAFAEYAKNSYLTVDTEISASWDLDLYAQIEALR